MKGTQYYPIIVADSKSCVFKIEEMVTDILSSLLWFHQFTCSEKSNRRSLTILTILAVTNSVSRYLFALLAAHCQ